MHQFLLTLTIAAALVTGSSKVEKMAEKMAPVAVSDRGVLSSFDGATAWLNTRPMAAADLRGKVVLVQFWTYSCINWRRSVPYVRAWNRKYGSQGLVVVGVHAPEFPFERSVTNVRKAAKDAAINYPIAVDDEYLIWRAFKNDYWPALFLLDAKGRIRYHYFGEGKYDEAERRLQALLAETASRRFASEPVSVNAGGVEAPADWDSLKSSENYLGYDRTEGFASPGPALLDERHMYTSPALLALNHWALRGGWSIFRQSAVSHTVGAEITYGFHARDLHLVMGPSTPGTSVRFRVLVDGHPPGVARGLDVDSHGYGTATEKRLYQLIRQPKPIADRQFEIKFVEPGIEVFSFTFG